VFVPLWQPASDIFLYACAYFEANKYDDDDDLLFLLRCGESEGISLKRHEYFKALWEWKQALQLLQVSRFSIGLFVIVSQPKRYHVCLCLSQVRVLAKRLDE